MEWKNVVGFDANKDWFSKFCFKTNRFDMQKNRERFVDDSLIGCRRAIDSSMKRVGNICNSQNYESLR